MCYIFYFLRSMLCSHFKKFLLGDNFRKTENIIKHCYNTVKSGQQWGVTVLSEGIPEGLMAQSVSESTSVDVDISCKWISLLKILQICKKNTPWPTGNIKRLTILARLVTSCKIGMV